MGSIMKRWRLQTESGMRSRISTKDGGFSIQSCRIRFQSSKGNSNKTYSTFLSQIHPIWLQCLCRKVLCRDSQGKERSRVCRRWDTRVLSLTISRDLHAHRGLPISRGSSTWGIKTKTRLVSSIIATTYQPIDQSHLANRNSCNWLTSKIQTRAGHLWQISRIEQAQFTQYPLWIRISRTRSSRLWTAFQSSHLKINFSRDKLTKIWLRLLTVAHQRRHLIKSPSYQLIFALNHQIHASFLRDICRRRLPSLWYKDVRNWVRQREMLRSMHIQR